MRLGLFLIMENWDGDIPRAYAEHMETIRQADCVGIDELWLAEHHFNDYSVSPSLSALLAYAAGITSRIDIGAAAYLLPFHDPVTIAEDVATLDILSHGRMLFGAAKGGPFERQKAQFGVEGDEARERMLEGLDLVRRLLAETSVDFSGKHYSAEGLTVYPRPVQPRVPTFIASRDETAIALAARHGFGLMAAHAWDLDRLRNQRDTYREHHPEGTAPELMASRSFLVAETDQAAREAARPHIRRFRKRMSRQGFGQRGEDDFFNEERLLANGVIGSPETCRQRLAELAEAGVTRVALKPATRDHVRARECLAAAASDLKPAMEACA